MQTKRRYTQLICIVTFLCLLTLLPMIKLAMETYQEDVHNTKFEKTILGVGDMRKLLYNNLTHYTYIRDETNILYQTIDTLNLKAVIDREHQRNFVKPEGEECRKRFPTGIIIGVDKCGTRELAEFLHLHPLVEVYSTNTIRGRTLEMDYFGANFSRGVDWFLSEMPCSYSNQMTFMKHSTYLFKSKTPKRIYDFNPKMKLILLVREPVSRTISRFMYEIFLNRIKASTALEEVLFQDGKLNEKHNLLLHSSYGDSLKNWLKYFSLSQIMIIESEDFKHKPGEVITQVEEFLGLPHYIKPETFVWNEEKGYYCIKTSFTENGISCYGNERGKSLININPETRAFLVEYFRSKNRNFFKLIGKTFDTWNY